MDEQTVKDKRPRRARSKNGYGRLGLIGGLALAWACGCHLVTEVGKYEKVTGASGGAGGEAGAASASGGAGGAGGLGGAGGVDPGCYAVGGTIDGLRGPLTLLNQAAGPLTVNTDGTFEIACLQEGESYLVTIDSAPAFQVCSIRNSSGTVAAADVTDIAIACELHVFFKGNDGTHGTELWITQGYTDISMVADVAPGSEDAFPGPPLFYNAVNGYLIFAADDGVAGRELWRSDLTPDGTEMIKDIVPGPGDSYYLQLKYHDGLVYYVRSTSTGTVLGRTDGTSQGTLDLPVTDSFNLTSYQGMLYMQADLQGSGVGSELYRWDGVEAQLVKDINPIGDSEPRHLFVWEGRLYFSADAGYGSELWVSDGTEEGTQRLHEINPSNTEQANVIGFTPLNGELFFFANDGTHGHELWKTDGTELGTAMVRDTRAGPESGIYTFEEMIGTGTHLFFPADDGIHGEEPWVSDGTTNGTFMLRNIEPNIDSQPGSWFAVDNQVYFAATESWGPTLRQLWTSDGTALGTVKFSDFFDDTHSSNPQFVGSAGGLWHVAAGSAGEGYEMWHFDGNIIQPTNSVCFGPCNGVFP